MEHIQKEDLRDLLRRVGASVQLVDEVWRKGIDGAVLGTMTEDEAVRGLTIDEHAAKQLIRVKERLQRDPSWADRYDESDELTAQALVGFYRRVKALEKVPYAKKILASYSDDPKLLMQMFRSKYPGCDGQLGFLQDWADTKQQQINKTTKLVRMIAKITTSLGITTDPTMLICSHADAPWLLSDLLVNEHGVPSSELRFLSEWGDLVTKQEMNTTKVKGVRDRQPRGKVPPPPSGAAPDWSIKYAAGSGDSEEVHRLRSVLAACTVEMKRQKIEFKDLHLKYVTQQTLVTRLEKQHMHDKATIYELGQRVNSLSESLAERDHLIMKLSTNSEVHELRKKLEAAHAAIHHTLGLNEGRRL
eukprot:TRINITY_DN9197_c0_g1_i1.p1 TRINITY_DN9197_c0_g1~~TRINITY_DN9197_c0_g1_i1.p1  ORF type:complete len:360 (+),score=110.54 TRINITY_DN9197_c0_g1_i1:53-1132(+)